MTPVTISIGTIEIERDMNAQQIGELLIFLSSLDVPSEILGKTGYKYDPKIEL